MTSIGPSLLITGEITSDEELVIDGRFSGQIVVRNAALTIGTRAQVEADIRGTRVQVLGKIQGNVAASDRIELGTSADVRGNLSANHIIVVDGATFTGRIDMDKRTVAAKVAQFKAAQPA